MSSRVLVLAGLLVAGALAGSGCAYATDGATGLVPELVDDAGAGRDAANVRPLPGTGDAASPADASSPADAAAPADATAPVDAGCGKAVLVINEVQAAGDSPSEEFVELFNPGSCAVDLQGFRLGYRSRTDGEGPSLYVFGGGDRIPAGGYFLVATTQVAGAKDATMSAGLAGDGGQVGLHDAGGALIDSMGYGSATGRYVKGRAAPDPGTTSVGRQPNGKNTGDNSADFRKLTAPTPGRAN